MIRIDKKLITLLVCITLLLTLPVSGTVAFLIDKPAGITNTFRRVRVQIEVTDTVSSYTKQSPTITNTGDVDVYVRAVVAAFWVKDGSIVGSWNEAEYPALILNDGWSRAGGFYYYADPIAPGESAVLFASYAQPANPPVAGAHLEMDVIAQAVQAEGMGASSAQDAFSKADGN